MRTLCKDRQEPYTIEEYEEAIKALDCSIKIMRDYFRALDTLEEKLDAQKCIGQTERARMNLRKNYYEQEDAINA